jgi:hypothetical protein
MAIRDEWLTLSVQQHLSRGLIYQARFGSDESDPYKKTDCVMSAHDTHYSSLCPSTLNRASRPLSGVGSCTKP